MSNEEPAAKGPPPESILLERGLTGQILEAAFRVHNTLGVGFLERVYQGTLMVELREMDIECEAESTFLYGTKASSSGIIRRTLLSPGNCSWN